MTSSPNTDDTPGSVSILLQAIRNGDRGAFGQLAATVTGELRGIARARLRRERPGSIDVEDLVQEVWRRVLALRAVRAEDRRQFYAFAHRCIANLLIDRGRRRHHREEHSRASPDGGCDPSTRRQAAEEDVDVRRALDRLRDEDPRCAEVVLLKAFGHSLPEISMRLGVSQAIIRKEWTYGQARLRQLLVRGDA